MGGPVVTGRSPRPRGRRPWWVTAAAAVAVVLLLVLLVALVAGGSHGPGRHASSTGLPADEVGEPVPGGNR